MKLLPRALLVALLIYCNPIFSGDFSNSPLIKALENKQSPSEIKRIIAKGADVNEIEYEFLRCCKPVLRYALDRGTDQESVEIIEDCPRIRQIGCYKGIRKYLFLADHLKVF